MQDEEDDGLEVRVAGPSEAVDEVADAVSDDDDGNVAGALIPETPMEPGVPDPENAAFVVLGAFLALFVFVNLVRGGGALEPAHWGVLVGLTALLGGGFYLFYARVA